MGSLMMRFTSRPAIRPASFVACLCPSLKYAAPTATNSQVHVDGHKASRRVNVDVNNHAVTQNQPVEAEKHNYLKSRPWLRNQGSARIANKCKKSTKDALPGTVITASDTDRPKYASAVSFILVRVKPLI